MPAHSKRETVSDDDIIALVSEPDDETNIPLPPPATVDRIPDQWIARHGQRVWAKLRLDWYKAVRAEQNRALRANKNGRPERWGDLAAERERETVLAMIGNLQVWGGPDDHEEPKIREAMYAYRKPFIDSLPSIWPARMHELHRLALLHVHARAKTRAVELARMTYAPRPTHSRNRDAWR